MKAEIKTVGDKGSNKVVCLVKHPSKTEEIQLSSVKFENKGKLETSGLWVNLDEDKKIRKNSALAVLLKHLVAADIEALENKEIMTVEDESGYLAFKAY